MGEMSPLKKGTVVVERPADADSPLLSDSNEVARQLELAKGKGLFSGILTLWRLRYEAWLEERLKEQIVRKLDTREKLAQRHSQTVVAEIALKGNLHTSKTEDQKHITAFNKAKRERLLSDLEMYAKSETITIGSEDASLPSGSSSSPPVSVHVSDNQIEALVLRAVMNLGTEGGEDDQWPAYREDLYKQLPNNVAQEVERRIQQMRSILR